MKIDELINNLQKIREIEGNIEVYKTLNDGDNIPVEKVYTFESEISYDKYITKAILE